MPVQRTTNRMSGEEWLKSGNLHPGLITGEAVAKIDDFLNRARVFTLSKVDGDKPRAHLLGLHMVIDDSIVFGEGDFKNVYRELVANPEAEITACIGRGLAEAPRQDGAPPRSGGLRDGPGHGTLPQDQTQRSGRRLGCSAWRVPRPSSST